MADLLTSPATLVFIDTLNFQNAIMYLGREALGSIWVKIAVTMGMWGIASLCSVMFLRSRFFRKQPSYAKFLTLWGVLSTAIFAAYKNIISKSAADEGIALVSVWAGPTNGVSRVDVVATGGNPEPMWYRNSTDETWIKGVEDGWTLEYAESDGTTYAIGWVHASAEDEVTAYNMWYFGENPPAIEIVEQGGVTIEGFAVCGRYIRISWRIDEEVELADGAVVTVECATDIGDGVEVWQTVFKDAAPVHTPMSWQCDGFHLDKTTKWRVKLEVSE